MEVSAHLEMRKHLCLCSLLWHSAPTRTPCSLALAVAHDEHANASKSPRRDSHDQ